MQNNRWRAQREEIISHLQMLLRDPTDALYSKRLFREHRGLRSARFGWRFRFLYKLCGECRLYGDQARYPLACCVDQSPDSTTPDHTINVLYLSDHYSDVPFGFGLTDETDPDD